MNSKENSKIKATTSKKTIEIAEQIDFIALANEVFKGSTPLRGEEYDTLTNSWLKSVKTTSNIKGML